jgi:glycosyltransferase involved in cell wall biosynthesis
MNVGLVTYYAHDPHESLAHIRWTTAAAVREAHRLQPYPEEFAFARPAQQRDLLKQWLSGCDAIVGTVDHTVLSAREEAARRPPCLCLLMGCLSRGGLNLVHTHRLLRTSDLLVGNCAADLALVAKFFPNAATTCIPFAFDDTQFFPVEHEGRSIRESLGIDADERILVYAGRITLEKNLHTLLRVFKIVAAVVPRARLVIAGEEAAVPFADCTTLPLGVRRTLARLVRHFDLPSDRVLFIGRRWAEDLRRLYSTADALVNLTLHHDENFGLAQVEAMACGLPVVGTTWGGLKDTIVDGVTGRHVRAVMTPTGVKVDWWQAANVIVELLAQKAQRERWRQTCAENVRSRYSMAGYRRAVSEVIDQLVGAAPTSSEPLCPSSFAERYWSTFLPPGSGDAEGSAWSARRSPAAWELYRELIGTFADTRSAAEVTATANAWCLAAPLACQADTTIAIDDPLYPMTIEVPPAFRRTVPRLVRRFAEHPVIPDTQFSTAGATVQRSLAWMHDTGLLLRTTISVVDPACANGTVGRPVFAIREVDHMADVVCIR